MITIKTNISEVTARLINKIQALGGKDVTRSAATSVLNMMTERIHEKGLAADGAAMGTYSPQYLKFRSSNGRGADNKKTMSFTRQLNNSLNVIGMEKGWGIGVLVSARNPVDNYLNKKNQAKGRKSTLTAGTVKKKNGRKRALSNNDLIKFQEKQLGKKVWSAITKEEKALAVDEVRKEVQRILNS